MPKIAAKNRIFGYTFDGYWRDIGTIDSYWQSSMEVMEMSQSFLADAAWPIYSREGEWSPTKVGNTATVTNCLLAGGCVIEGHIEHSIISQGVYVAEGSTIKDSIIMDDIETGSIVGAGTVVIKPIEAYTVVAGNPAQLIRRRN